MQLQLPIKTLPLKHRHSVISLHKLWVLYQYIRVFQVLVLRWGLWLVEFLVSWRYRRPRLMIYQPSGLDALEPISNWSPVSNSLLPGRNLWKFVTTLEVIWTFVPLLVKFLWIFIIVALQFLQREQSTVIHYWSLVTSRHGNTIWIIGNPLDTDGLPSQRVRYTEHWCFFNCYTEQAGVHTAELTVIWEVSTIMCQTCDMPTPEIMKTKFYDAIWHHWAMTKFFRYVSPLCSLIWCTVLYNMISIHIYGKCNCASKRC